MIWTIIAVLVALYYYFTAYFNFWKNRSISGPKPVPIFGNMFSVITCRESLRNFIQELYVRYKNEPMYGIFVRRKPVLVVQDPEIIKDVLIKDFPKFANRGFLMHDIAEPLSQHIFSLEAKRWRPLRTHLSPVFTSAKLKGMFSLILECSNHLESYLDTLVTKGEIVEIREVAAKFTTNVIGSCAFGIDMNSLTEEESQFRRIGKDIFHVRGMRLLRLRFKECMGDLYNFLGYFLPYDKVTVFLKKLTVDTLKYRQEHNVVRHDFMNTLLELRNHPEKLKEIELSDNFLAAQAFLFFAAGFETSSTTMTNALYELALNQDVQDKLREELIEFSAKNDGEWSYETIKEMTYLDKVFKETLRKYPVSVLLLRETTENYIFRDMKVSIPKGQKVWIPMFSIHRDPNIYPEPEKFDPERFSEEAVEARHPMHYLPFGLGPRNCIGARFGTYQTKIGLIKILRSHKVDVCEKTPIPYEFCPVAFVLVPKGGVHLKVTKIEN
ncbi:PREDICTED: probable cytochrome P450 6a14 [Eufriesea mexicana]|uniref:probable cytochrome P450 6a14 n=1 Tax=Eufriesea mexicana TaxID=516756 RepID=UPI00083C2E1F|nr:PREDICTED: probable cytochrome P450 6a14 [Eufriesea mexicana]